MTPEKYEKINEFFLAALEMPPERRGDYLTSACGEDLELRQEVERLIVGHERAGNFLSTPAIAPALDMLSEEEKKETLVAGREISHYRILSPLGKGGMGEVYLAQDLHLDRKVAIKLLPASFTRDAGRVRRFEREARAASALNHPNIITIYEIGHDDDLHFIATEYIEGETLRQRIKRGPLELAEALDIAIQSSNALRTAHAAGIVHRDIKPENIMLRPDGYIKILDFGLAKLTERNETSNDNLSGVSTLIPNETMPGTVLGTISYMSPEQARGYQVDARSDIWSLGVVIYEMLTAHAPFEGATQTDIMVSILERDPESITKLNPHIPVELERILDKALAKNWNDRYANAKDLATDLKSLSHRQEFETELARSSDSLEPLNKGREATPLSPPATQPVPAQSTDGKSRLARVLVLALCLLAVVAVGIVIWSLNRGVKPQQVAVQVLQPQSERVLSYSLTVQKMRDRMPYDEPFESYGQGFFENGWRFRINISSPQDGFLYLLNEAESGRTEDAVYMIFPISSFNNGQAHLQADQPIQSGWYEFSKKPGSEKLWFIWSAEPVRELESVRGVVNPVDMGLISDGSQLKEVRAFLKKYSESKPQSEKDRTKKMTTLRMNGDILVVMVEIEHH